MTRDLFLFSQPCNQFFNHIARDTRIQVLIYMCLQDDFQGTTHTFPTFINNTHTHFAYTNFAAQSRDFIYMEFVHTCVLSQTGVYNKIRSDSCIFCTINVSLFTEQKHV